MLENLASHDIPVLLSPGKAAEVIGVNRKTVQRWLDDHLIETHATVGALRLIHADEVIRIRDERAAKKAARKAKTTAKAAAA